MSTAQWHPEAKSAPVRYEHIVCGTCHGTGLTSWTFHEVEVQERCARCDGKKSVVVERYS